MKTGVIHGVVAGAMVVAVMVMCGCKRELTAAPGAAPRPEKAASAAPAGDAPAAKKPGAIVVVNKVCPIMVEHPVRKNLEMSLTREYKGKLIGFCCSDCPEAWDALSDEDKEQALADAAKTEAGAAGGK